MSFVIVCFMVVGTKAFEMHGFEDKELESDLEVALKAFRAKGRKTFETLSAEEASSRGPLVDLVCREKGGTLDACTCDFACPDVGRCAKAERECADDGRCEFVVVNGAGTVGSLRRTMSRAEVARSTFVEETWSSADLEREKGALFASSAAARRNYSGAGGFRGAVGHALMRLEGAFLDGPRCGSSSAAARASLGSGLGGGTLALVVVSSRTPSRLRTSLRSWHESGLLSLVDERFALFNDPLPADVAVATRYGFSVSDPNSLGGVPGASAAADAPLKTTSPDVFAPGVAFAAALGLTDATYVLYFDAVEKGRFPAPRDPRAGLF